MLYSVRMRAAQGGAHEAGGRHISGAERIVSRENLGAATIAMQERALMHSRGKADFITMKIEAIDNADILCQEVLPVRTCHSHDVLHSRWVAQAELSKAGVSLLAIQAGLCALTELKDSIRGAMLLCAQTGRRMDGLGKRGVRVSRMDSEKEESFTSWLNQQGYHTIHTREALILASKVAGATGTVAEICWSDDPEYTTGYVASSSEYVRIPHMKPQGLPQGGRVFFIQPKSDVKAIIAYLEQQPVLITVPEEVT